MKSGKSKPPPPPAPAPMPVASSVEVEDARSAARRRAQQMRGRSSTILTDFARPVGDLGDQRKTLLGQ